MYNGYPLASYVQGPYPASGSLDVGSIEAPPLAPPSLLDGFPKPEQIERRKADYLKSLDEQVRQHVAVLTQKHQVNLEFLRAKNEQQKRHAEALIDEQLMKSEMDLDRRHDDKLLAMQQDAMRKKFDIAKEASSLTLEFHSRQMQEKLQFLDYELHMKYFEAATPSTSSTYRPKSTQAPRPDYGASSQALQSYTNGFPNALTQQESAGGKLFVVVHAGHNLKNTDTGVLGDVSDPYVVVKLGDQEFTTPTINNDLNPIWSDGNKFTFSVSQATKLLHLEVMNSNFVQNDSLGRTSLDFRSLPHGIWNRRRELLKDGDRGEVEYDVNFVPG